ncbi:MAG TPA: hypothetical protein VM164_00800 [Burkholderiales bacterium]|nr:hypothetical protein [Burkholderiales bacterium]
MKIKRIEPIAVSLPMAKPIKMAGVELRTADNVLVRLETGDGIVGWGEAASAPTMTGETVESSISRRRCRRSTGGVSPTSPYLAEDILARPLEFSRGHAVVPSGPGLGIEVDEARVRRFAIKP